MVIAYVENTYNLTRSHIAKKAAEYGLVKRVAEPNEISSYFKIPDTGMKDINKLLVQYNAGLEKLMDNEGITGLERPAFLAAEALGTDISQGFSFAVGNVVIETGNTKQVKVNKHGYQLVMTFDEFEERVNIAVDRANFSNDIFLKEEFGDWLKKSVSLSLRSVHKFELPRFYLFDKIYAQWSYRENLNVGGPLFKLV
jgi:hypothetical protein